MAFKGFRKSKKKKDEDELLTKLHTAKTAYHVKKYLVDRDMPPDQLNKEGDAPIHYYIKRQDQNRFECLMAFLIHSPRSDIIDLVNSEGMTALHLACKRNDILSTKALVAFDADLNLINYDNCTPLDIAADWYRSISDIPRLLVELGGTRAKDIKQMQRQDSEEYDEGGYKPNPMASYFEEDQEETGPQEPERTIRTRFGLDMQLMSMRNLDGPPSHEFMPAMYFGGLEFHDGRGEGVDEGGQGGGAGEGGRGKEVGEEKGQPQGVKLESQPEEKKPSPSPPKNKSAHFRSPDSSVIEMGLTEASVILAKENIQPDTPESSVLSGTSVLRNTKFLSASPRSVSPVSIESPIEQSTEEADEAAAQPTQEQLAKAYAELYPSTASPATPYQPVTNPMSLEQKEEGDDWVKVKGPSKPRVTFASPEEEDKELPGYAIVNGGDYHKFRNKTMDKLEQAILSSPPNDEGYAAWLQWREMMKAKKRREEIRKQLELGEDYTDTTTNLLHPSEAAPQKPFTVRRPGGAPPVVRRQHWRQKQYLRQHSLGSGSLNVMKSLLNPSVAVHKSILGSSVAPFLIREERGERILCLDGGGIKGLIQIEILKHIQEEAGRPITELFDWIVGTSTGAVVALGLVYGKRSLDDLKKMYFELKDRVFKRQSKLIPTVCDTDALEDILKRILGEDTKLNSVRKPKVLVTAVDKSTSDLKLRFFNNCFQDDFSYQLVWKVARYTSAAPFYFRELDNYVDGGVRANNPCQHALRIIQMHLRSQRSSPYLQPSRPARHKNPPKPRIACLLSIGCGKFPPEPIGNANILEAVRISKIHNAPQLLNNLLKTLSAAFGQAEDEALLCQNNCEEQEIPFYRFSPKLGDTVGTAETDNMKLCDLIIGAKKLLVENQEHIEKMIEHLKVPD